MTTGNETQVRMIAEQVAEAAVTNVLMNHPELRKADIPAPLKWASVIISGLFTAGAAALVFWLVTSVSEMGQTLAIINERMANGAVKDGRFDEIERRVVALESHVSKDDKRGYPQGD